MSPWLSTRPSCLLLTSLLLHLSLTAMASEPRGPAVVSIKSPASLAGNYLGYFGTFSGAGGLAEDATSLMPENNSRGCSAYGSPVRRQPTIAIVHRGICTFEDKALNAQRWGATGIIVVGDTDEMLVMASNNESASDEATSTAVRIFAVAVQRTLGDNIGNWSAANRNSSLIISVEPYVAPSRSSMLLDLSFAIQILVATSLVVAGAYFATADLQPGSPFVPRHDEVLEITGELAVGYCILGSVMLVVLFYLMKYMVYGIILSFCIGGASAVVQIVGASLGYFFPPLQQEACPIFPSLCSVTRADLIASPVAAFLVGGFLWFRNTEYGFIFQNIIGAGFLCTLQRQLRLPNLKIATLLLSVMFFFDIFWVFLSPLIFRKSVMIEVAKGGGTGESVPMLIRIPTVGNSGIVGERMLGFGDIALPGLLISYLLRFDMLNGYNCRRGYFMPGTVAYAAGLFATMVALIFSGAGQPALLYLVPATVGTTLCLGWFRSELPRLWEGVPEDTPSNSSGGSGEVAMVNCPHRATYRARKGQPDDSEELHELVDSQVIGAEERGS